jgi:glycerol uptake facilitator protein
LPSPDNYWWVPIVGPLIGGIVGGAAYQYLVHPFLPARQRALEQQRQSASVNSAQ